MTLSVAIIGAGPSGHQGDYSPAFPLISERKCGFSNQALRMEAFDLAFGYVYE